MDLVRFEEGINASATATVAKLLHNPDQGWVNMAMNQFLKVDQI